MRRGRKGISNMIAVLILLAITVFAGVMLFIMTSGMFRTSGRAAISLSGTGTGASDGKSAVLNLVLTNNGEAAGRITNVYIEPLSPGLTMSSPAVLGTTTVIASILTTGVPTPVTPMPSGLDLPPSSTQVLSVRILGANLYPGVQIRVYVLFYDVGSQTPGFASTIVTLK